MHKISNQTVQDLAAEIVELCLYADTEKILVKSRALYEQSVLLHFQKSELLLNDVVIEVPTAEVAPTDLPFETTPIPIVEVPKPIAITPEPIFETTATESKNPGEVFHSVEDRIKQIMENAGNQAAAVTRDLPEITELFIEEKVEIVEEVIKSPEPLFEVKKSMPQISKDEEMGESIPADIAADMFERADKINTVKKSLNDRLSQQQLQIGLNDRIAFVKHLFDGNLADFNRVLSQLNSFETESQAKDFINNIVKSDYNWSEKIEYEERLIQLIERKFL
ncbi:MAG: hypothetical protein IT220_01075 [Flavobacteriaceae bacterium]|nr:hypothetical protein [Flavobacteriaceae bacterium]